MELKLTPTHKVQFLQLKDYVKSQLDMGYSFTSIWKGLKEAGRISMSYSQFCRHIAAYIQGPSR
jgi:hypothetical protein